MMRIAALLFIVAGGGGVYGASQYGVPSGAIELFPGAAIAVGIFGFVFALVWALVLWGFADGLVLLADLDDAQRATQRQLADLTLAQRTARGPFHAEVVAASSKPPEGG